MKRYVSFQFLVGLLGRRISSLQGPYLHRRIQTENECRETSMPRVGFESTIPVFMRAKTVHALDRTATLIVHSNIRCGQIRLGVTKNFFLNSKTGGLNLKDVEYQL
jgi:hypothetical protein